MFGGYHSGEESSPESEGFDQYCVKAGAVADGKPERCSVNDEDRDPKLQDNLTDFDHCSIVLPAKSISFCKMAVPLSTLRLRSEDHFSFRTSLHSLQTNKRNMFQAFFSENRSGLPQIRSGRSINARMSFDGVHPDVDAVKLGTAGFWSWSNWFEPLNRVLMIAVTLTAASALRQRDDDNKIRSLEAALQDRIRECRLLHEKVRQLQEHLSFWKESVVPFFARAGSVNNMDDRYVGMSEATPRCDAVTLEQFATPQLWQKRSEMNGSRLIHDEARNCVPEQDEGLAKDMIKRNVNSPVIAPFSERLSVITTAEEQFDDASTPSLPLEKLMDIATPQWPASEFPLNQIDHPRQEVADRGLGGRVESTKLEVGTDAWNEALEDVNKTLSLCIEDCHMKDLKISRLEEEITVLHGIISDLRTLQVNQVTGEVDASSLQTFVTSNVLYNLEMSPIEATDTSETPQCLLSPWKDITRLTDSFELSMVRDSLEKEQNGYADVESCKSQSSPKESPVDSNKERIPHISCSDMEGSFELCLVNDLENIYGFLEVDSSKSEDVKSDRSRKNLGSGTDGILQQKSFSKCRKANGDIDQLRWSSSSSIVEQATPVRTSSASQTESLRPSSAGRYGQSRNKADRSNIVFTSPTRPARKLRYSSSVSSSYSFSEQIEDGTSKRKAGGGVPHNNQNDSGQLEDDVTDKFRTRRKKSERDSNVLSGVEPNTISKRDGKWVNKSKHLRNSLDGLNKANENRGQRKRWK